MLRVIQIKSIGQTSSTCTSALSDQRTTLSADKSMKYRKSESVANCPHMFDSLVRRGLYTCNSVDTDDFVCEFLDRNEERTLQC